MDEKYTRELFNKMVDVVKSKKDWHNRKRSFYDGDHSAPDLGVSLPEAYRNKVFPTLAWARLAVDRLLSDISFDAFENDLSGFTRLLWENDGYAAIESAQRNSMIGACSFVAVLPREDGSLFFNTYSGDRGTMLYNPKDGFYAGIVANKVESSSFSALESRVSEWILFLKGRVLVLDGDGKVLGEYEPPTDRLLLVPFFFGRDVATKPFGESRINSSAESAIDMFLRTIKLIEVSNDVTLSQSTVIFLESKAPETYVEEQAMSSTQVKDSGGAFSATVVDNVQGAVRQIELSKPDPTKIQNTLEVARSMFSEAVSMPASEFSASPVSGALSADSMKMGEAGYRKTVQRAREDYARSIRELALTAMVLYSGGQFQDEWNLIVPRFIEDPDAAKLSEMGDALLKVTQAVPSLRHDKLIENVVASSVGRRFREDALKVELPSKDKAVNVGRKMSGVLSDADKVVGQ